jgi:hypothetical protein
VHRCLCMGMCRCMCMPAWQQASMEAAILGGGKVHRCSRTGRSCSQLAGAQMQHEWRGAQAQYQWRGAQAQHAGSPEPGRQAEQKASLGLESEPADALLLPELQ